MGNLSGRVLARSYDTPDEADLKAIESDWRAVGGDLRTVINEYAQQK